jgi:hypothetical protein
MTEDEKRNQKAMLLLDYQEAEQELAHLRTKAAKLSGDMYWVREWLDHAAKGNNDDKTRTEDGNIRANFRNYSETLKMEALLALVDDIHKAEGKVATLAGQKTSLGLK